VEPSRDERLDRLSSIMARKNLALFLSGIGFAAGWLAMDQNWPQFIAVCGFLASMFGVALLVSVCFCRCPFCGNRVGFAATIGDAFNPRVAFRNLGPLYGRCLSCGAKAP